MKKILFTLLVAILTFGHADAQSGLISAKKIYSKQTDFSKYEKAGAVPMADGRVVFEATITTEGKSKDELYKILSSWSGYRFAAGTKNATWKDANFFCNLDWAQVTEADKQEGHIRAQGAEEMVFSNKPLAKDYSHVFYMLDMQAEDGKISLRMHNIIFAYVGSQVATRTPAEDMITDKYGLNKKGKLARINGKFRLKTIDLFDEFVDELTELAK